MTTFGVTIHRVREALIRRLESALAQADLGINFSQFRVLKTLADGRATTAGEIARWIGHDAGAMTRLLDRLSDLGYLRREGRADDRRQIGVVLTDEGRRIAQDLSLVAEKAMAPAWKALTLTEQQTLMSLLHCVLNSLEQSPPPTKS